MNYEFNRLTNDRDFQRVYKKGVTFFSRNVVLKVFDNGLKTARVGIVVSKKISKKATERNKVKRSIRELIRLRLVKLIKGKDYIFMPKKTYNKANIKEKKEDLEYLLNK